MNSKSNHELIADVQRVGLYLIIFLFVSELFLVGMDLLLLTGEWLNYRPIRTFFNMTREDSLASWLMTTQTFLAALVLWFIYWVSKNYGRASKGWMVLALFFSYMAVDDGAMIHERIGSTLELIAYKSQKHGEVGYLTEQVLSFPSYDWHLVVMPFFVVMGMYILFFLWKRLEDKKLRLTMIFALMCLAIAVVLDFIEGMDASSSYNLYSWIKASSTMPDYKIDHFGKVVEEFLEMFAISLFLYLFVCHIQKLTREQLRVTIK